MGPDEHLLRRHDPCPWLPPGGVADVLATERDTPPKPTVVVRLLATSQAGVLVVPRADGRGLDLPSRAAGENPLGALATLRETYVPTSAPPRLLGYVLNKVSEGAADYPWPVPRAYFAVWRCAVAPGEPSPGEPRSGEPRSGEWLPHDHLEAKLGQRHWWPLVRSAGLGPA